MPPRFISLGAVPFLLALGAVPVLALTDFSGQWRFSQKGSDDLKAAVSEAAGPAYTSGDAKREMARIGLRALLLELAGRPEDLPLTVEQTATEFRFGFGDDVEVYYFDREGIRQDATGEKHKTRLEWRGQQLFVEDRGDKGSTTTQLFTLLPGARQLTLAVHLKSKSLRKPLDLRLMFDRVAPSP